jgi:hypothetical protein
MAAPFTPAAAVGRCNHATSSRQFPSTAELPMEVIMMRRSLIVALCAIAGSTMAIGRVHADPIEREHYSGTDSFSFDDCGFQIDGVNTFSGVFMLKQGRAGDPTPYLFDNFKSEVVYTNPATGAWFREVANGLYKDLRITNVGGTVYQFEAFYSGQPFRVYDMHGNLVIRDRGNLRVGFQVDTLGDQDLDNDIFIEDSFEVLADNGAHPGFYIDFCELAGDLIG